MKYLVKVVETKQRKSIRLLKEVGDEWMCTRPCVINKDLIKASTQRGEKDKALVLLLLLL